MSLPYSRPPRRSTVSLLRPLLALSNLTLISITIGTLHLDDFIIPDMVLAWPRLQLSSCPTNIDTQRVTSIRSTLPQVRNIRHTDDRCSEHSILRGATSKRLGKIHRYFSTITDI